MTGNRDTVQFPCERETWQVVQALLGNLKNLSQSLQGDLKELCKEHQTIVDISNGLGDTEETSWGECILYGLVKFLKKQASKEERRVFLQSTFPAIIDLALDHPNVIPAQGIPYSKQQHPSTTVISRRCVASILACGFLCLFEERGKPWISHQLTNVINFTNFFKNLQMSSQFAKLRCILNYFEQVGERGKNLEGNVTFVRQVITREEMPTMDSWLNCDLSLCPLKVYEDGVIEDAGCQAVEVDFANKYIGGGVLGRGRVQEEIRFTVCPELIGSMLFMEYMDENEAIIIKGFEQFSATQGYAGSLLYAGPYSDPATRDEKGDLMTTLCAIDAVSYRNQQHSQYSDYMFIRDINKAYVGFSARCLRGVTPPRETGMAPSQEPGGQTNLDSPSEDKVSTPTDEEYLTATDDEVEEDGNLYLNGISNLADGLLVDILSSALLEASSKLKGQGQAYEAGQGQKNQPSLQTCNDTNSVKFSTLSKPDVDTPMEGKENLDVDLADWVSRFRRRSSNLSDVGSRSSTASTRHSSEFSSEFEEFYENFQKREQPVIQKTIKEEKFLDINEFAVNLAAKLLHEGTFLAAHINKKPGIQNFHSDVPDGSMAKPKARKLSSDSTNSDSSVTDSEVSLSEPTQQHSNKRLETSDTKCDISEATARRFADNFIRTLFPFPEQITTDSDKPSCDEGGGVATFSSTGTSDRQQTRSESSASSLYTAYTSDLLKQDMLTERNRKKTNTDLKSKSKESRSSSRINTREMKLVATDFVHGVVIGALQKYSEELDSDISIQDIDHDTFDDTDSDTGDHELEQECANESENTDILDIKLMTEHPSGGEVSGEHDEKSFDSSNCDSCLGDSASVCGTKILDQVFSEGQKQVCETSTHSLDRPTSTVDVILEVERLDESCKIPQVMITDESRPEQRTEELYFNVAEKLVQEQVANALLGMTNSQSSDNVPNDMGARPKTEKVPRKGKLKPKPKKISERELEPPRNKYFGHSSNSSGSCLSLSRDNHRDIHVDEREPRKVTFFASSLSRDLLTNAFVEVQRNMNGGNIFRRSSEPLKISNHAAKCLIENSTNGTNGKGEKHMSLTDEDVGRFAQELSRWGSLEEFRAELRRGSCGFRDPTLSRFAEQLMKSDCKIPDFHFLESTNWSTSGDSSVSFVSSVSGFKDTILAGFEEELLNASCTKAVSRSPKYTRFVYNKKIPKIARQRSLVKEKDNGVVDLMDTFSVLKGGRGKSFDSEISALSWGSYQSSPSQSGDEFSSYADKLAERILQESIEALFHIEPEAEPCLSDSEFEDDETCFQDFANNMANDILLQSLVSLATCYATYRKEKKRLSDANTSTTSEAVSEIESRTSTDAASVSSVQRSVSDDYTDALDIPFRQLENYAEELAASVLQHSVNVFQRELDSEKKRVYGRPISTGNWGCGAFRGDPHLKSMLQWMAASYAGVPYVFYYTFQHPDLDQLQEVIDSIRKRGWNVGQLMQALRCYCVTVREMDEADVDKPNLFQLLLSDDAFRDIH